MPSKIPFRLPLSVVESARAAAHRRGVSFSEYVNGVVNDYSLAVFGKRHTVYAYRKQSASHKRRRGGRAQCACFPGVEGLLQAERLRKTERSPEKAVYWRSSTYRRLGKICRTWRACGFFYSKNTFLAFMLLFPR